MEQEADTIRLGYRSTSAQGNKNNCVALLRAKFTFHRNTMGALAPIPSFFLLLPYMGRRQFSRRRPECGAYADVAKWFNARGTPWPGGCFGNRFVLNQSLVRIQPSAPAVHDGKPNAHGQPAALRDI